LTCIRCRYRIGAERSETASHRLPRRGERREAARSNKKLNEHASSVFDTGKEREQEDFGEERTALHSKIGELSVQVDFLAKKSRQLGVWTGPPSSSNHNTRS
jgi:hypothetical protein